MKNQNETEILKIQKKFNISDDDPVFMFLKAQCEAISRLEHAAQNNNKVIKLNSYMSKKVELEIEQLKQYRIELDLRYLNMVEYAYKENEILAKNLQYELKKSKEFLTNNNDLLSDFRISLAKLKAKTEEIAGDRVMVLVAVGLNSVFTLILLARALGVI